jgi:hypothetical protein
MPVKQGTIDKGKGRYAIAYAFQPGQNGVRLSYVLPYTGNHATVRAPSSYDAKRVLLVIPPTMQISSPGFNAAGTEQGFNVFSKDSIKAGTAFDIAINGTAPPPSEQSASGPPDQVNGRDSGSDSGPSATVQTAPARLDNDKWILLGGLAAIFAVGVGLLFRQPVLAQANVPATSTSPGPRANKVKRQAQTKPSSPSPSSTSKSAPAVPLDEKIQQEVDTNLESLKDSLLRMELRRQAGTISDEEYARERGRAEQLLRELVQG